MAMAVFSATLTPSLSFTPMSRTKLSSHPSVSFSASTSSFFNNTFTAHNSRTVRNAVSGRSIKGGSLSCTCIFGLGVPELVVIAGVAALVFGPKKLPEVGRSIGKTVKSFQQAAKEFESELKKESDFLTEPAAEKTVATKIEEERQENNTKESS